MKVALISGAWPPAVCGVADGIFIYTRFLLEDEGQSAVVITTRGCRALHEEGAGTGKGQRLRVLDIIEEWTFRAYLNIVRALERERPDIVHIEYSTREYKRHVFINLLPILLRHRGYKVVITLHEYSFNLSWRGRARLWPSIAGAHAVLVSDPAYIRDIRKIFKRKFMDVIPIAPNIPSSTLTAGEREKLRREISPAGSLILGYFGFINANKIVLPVLHAVKMLRDIHGMSVVLMLLGDIFERDPSNPLVRALHNEITALGIEKNIFSTGYVSDVRAADYLSILDYAVLLYRSGISPRNATFLAAAAQNINIISTCNPSYMPSYRKLFLIEPEGDIASGIVDIVLKNGSGARESAIGSALYEQCWKAFVKKHLEVYRRVLMS